MSSTPTGAKPGPVHSVGVDWRDACESMEFIYTGCGGGAERPVGLFVDSADGDYANLVVTPLKP